VAHEAQLPSSISKLVRSIDRLNTSSSPGFRRRNVAALLSKYFFDMTAVFRGIGRLMRPGRPVYVVVGNNHTIAGGERVEIATADLLGDAAEMLGFKRRATLPMEVLQSRDIFRVNASPRESLLMLEAPAGIPTTR
jgi:site-specific DNA-methyltransferase (cytosine-N4-specific)